MFKNIVLAEEESLKIPPENVESKESKYLILVYAIATMVFFSLVNKYFGGEGLVSADHSVSTAIELLHIPASTSVVCATEPNLGKIGALINSIADLAPSFVVFSVPITELFFPDLVRIQTVFNHHGFFNTFSELYECLFVNALSHKLNGMPLNPDGLIRLSMYVNHVIECHKNGYGLETIGSVDLWKKYLKNLSSRY